MKRHLLTIALFFCAQWGVHGQKDTAKLDFDAIDADELLSELESLLDSVTKPKSFASVSLMAGNRLLNVQSQAGTAATTQSLLLSPAAAYYHKSGFGAAASTSFFLNKGNASIGQHMLTASYDYLRQPALLTGIAYSRFIRPDSLNFYSSPLKNEIAAYAMYRKSWLKPAVSLAYGWGTRSEVTEQTSLVEALRKNRKRKSNRPPVPVTTVTNTTESVSDWLLSVSARHDFYWFNVLSSRDNVRFSPQVAVNSGTQRYGFNQSSNTYLVQRSDANSKPFFSDQVALEDATRWQMLSMTAFLRTAYSRGKFFVQPQLILDYYIPAADNNFTTSFAVNAGLIF